MINMKIRLLKSYKYFRKRYKPILGLLQKASFLSFFRSIMSNVIIEIKHIHINVEYSPQSNLDFINLEESSNNQNKRTETKCYNDDKAEVDIKSKVKGHPLFKKLHNNDYYSDEDSIDSSSDEDIEQSTRFILYELFTKETNQSNEKDTVLGIVIKHLVIHNPENYIVSTNEKITKEVVISDLAVYMDEEQNSVNFSTNEQFISEMNNKYDSKKHNWILKPFSFSSLIKYEKDNPSLLIEPIMKKILVNIREDYIPLLLEFLNAFDTFQKVISVAHIPKYQSQNPQFFWSYVHKCAMSKISNPSYDFKQSLSLLIKRIIFIKNYKKKNEKCLAIIKEMEETLDYSTIVAFRAAYRLSHRKKKIKGNQKLQQEQQTKL